MQELEAHKERAGAKAGDLIFVTRMGQLLNRSDVRRDVWTKLVKRAGVRPLDLYSLRHTMVGVVALPARRRRPILDITLRQELDAGKYGLQTASAVSLCSSLLNSSSQHESLWFRCS